MNNSSTLLGWVSAYAGGTGCHKSTVEARTLPNGSVSVKRIETNSIDGLPDIVKFNMTINSPVSPRRVLDVIALAFDNTIICYGTPAKRFRWLTGVYGLNKAKCSEALRVASYPTNK